MTSSISGSGTGFWVRMFGALCLYLGLEFGLFVAVKLVLHATVEELAGPYLAFAVPGAITLLMSWRLRAWEEYGPSPRRLALGWGLGAAIFFSAVAAAFFYSGMELRLLDPSDMGIFIAVGTAGVLIASFSLYHTALPRLSARAAKDAGGARPSYDM